MRPLLHDPAPVARPLTASRCRGLKGRFRVPAEPTIGVLALLAAALARGQTVIYADTASRGAAVGAALALIAALGAPAETHEDRWLIEGLGPLGLLAPARPLSLAGSGRTLPLALGLLAAYDFDSRIEMGGDALPRHLVDALHACGATMTPGTAGQHGLTLRGARPALPFHWPASAAAEPFTAEALLLAGLGTPGRSRLSGLASRPERALRLLRHFGAEITERSEPEGLTLDVTGLAALGARTLAPAGDPNLAALVVVAALIVPNSEVVVENMLVDPARAGFFTVLDAMGGDIKVLERREVAGEAVADLKVSHSPLLGVDIDPGGLDRADLMALALAAAFASGETRLQRSGDAREAALYTRLAAALSLNGATARLDNDGLVIGRPRSGIRLGGSTVEAGRDPLLAAAILVLGLGATAPISIADDTALSAAFPDFLAGLGRLGAQFSRRTP